MKANSTKNKKSTAYGDPDIDAFCRGAMTAAELKAKTLIRVKSRGQPEKIANAMMRCAYTIRRAHRLKQRVAAILRANRLLQRVAASESEQ